MGQLKKGSASFVPATETTRGLTADFLFSVECCIAEITSWNYNLHSLMHIKSEHSVTDTLI